MNNLIIIKNRKKVLKKYAWVFFLFIFFVKLFFAEDIRGLITQEINIKNEANYSKQVAFIAGEMLSLSLEKDSEFLTGLQLEITLSDQLKQNAEYFAIEIFSNIKPAPDINTISYTGNNVFFQVLPYLNTVNVKISLNIVDTKHQTPGNYSLTKALKIEQFPLLFTIQVISKGVSDSVLQKKFYIKIKPELIKKGYLNLKIDKPEFVDNDKIKIYIDGIKVSDWKSALLLNTGVHTLKITAENCVEENSSFFIDTGKNTNLEVTLKESISKIFIEMLSDTQVFIDGNKIDSIPKNGIPVSPGNHTLRFKIGDYSVSKSVYINEGKRYNISLFFTIDIKEN